MKKKDEETKKKETEVEDKMEDMELGRSRLF